MIFARGRCWFQAQNSLSSHAKNDSVRGLQDSSHHMPMLVCLSFFLCVLKLLLLRANLRSCMPTIWFWTYVQPAGSQRSPCVGRCTQAPARCACWLRSGPGPLVAQDRPPLSPPPHRTALLCSSSSGPGAAAASRARAGGGGQGGSRGQRQG